MCYGDITPVLNKHDPNRGVGRVPDYDVTASAGSSIRWWIGSTYTESARHGLLALRRRLILREGDRKWGNNYIDTEYMNGWTVSSDDN